MAQLTQKRLQKISFALRVFRIIKRDKALPKEAELKCTLSNISYWARKLSSLGIIKKTSPKGGTYKTLVSSDEAYKIIHKSYTKKILVTTKTPVGMNSKYKRVHSIQFKVTLPKFDKWYKVLQIYLDKKELPYIKNKKNQYKVTFMYKGAKYTFLLCKDTILGYLPSGRNFITDDVDLAVNLAYVEAGNVIEAFSNYFGKDLRIKGEFKYTITRRHIAIMNNEIAKTMHNKKKEIKVYVNGKLRVITDKSFNWDEFEAITLKDGVSDVKAVERHIEDVIKQKHTITDVKKQLLKEIADNRIIIQKQNELIAEIVGNNSKILEYLKEKDHTAFSQFR